MKTSLKPFGSSFSTKASSSYSGGVGDGTINGRGGPGGVTNMTVDHNHFYWGHGMSIGSETNGGSAKIRVSDLSLDGPDNDIRIKSNGCRGGLVHDVVYDDDAPVTILVLDELNSRFEDMSFSRQMMMKYRIAKHSPTRQPTPRKTQRSSATSRVWRRRLCLRGTGGRVGGSCFWTRWSRWFRGQACNR
jgi:polygalacturonase